MEFIVVRCHLDNSNNEHSVVYRVGFKSDVESKYPMVRLLCPTFYLGADKPYLPEVVNEFKSREEAEEMIDRIDRVLIGVIGG